MRYFVAREKNQALRTRGFFPGFVPACLAILGFVAVSCTNGAKLSSQSINTLLTSGSSSSTSSISTIYISSIVRDNGNPTGTIDVVGLSSGAFGTYCTPLSSGSSSGASTCSCQYDYTDPSSGQAVESTVNTTYVENNLVECPITNLPAALTTMNVTLIDSSPSLTSNTVTFNFNTGGTSYNSQLASSFAQVKRYSCIPKVYVQDVLDTDSKIYDPVLSENPRNAYPINYYTTNLGLVLNLYAGGAGSNIKTIVDYDCPTNPFNPATPPSAAAQNFRSSIYSVAALSSTGSQLISGGNQNTVTLQRDMNAPNARSTFYLAKAQTGVYNVPVNAYQLPETPSPVASFLPSLGYAASNIPTGTGTETCPSVTPPTGFQWAKLWQFRATLPQRIAPVSYALQQLTPIGCNPGPWPSPAPSGTSGDLLNMVPDCGTPTSGTSNGGNDAPHYLGTNGTTDAAVVAKTALANRFSPTLLAGMCWAVKPGGDYSNNSNDASYFDGTDLWYPRAQDSNYGCNGTSSSMSDPSLVTLLNLCATKAPTNIPVDTAPTAYPIDPAGTERYEFLFVVSPITVNTSDMTSSSTNSSIASQYTPFRFLNDTYCNLDSPASTGANCLSSNQITGYGLSLQDVNNATDTTAPNIFPLCVLQPTGLE